MTTILSHHWQDDPYGNQERLKYFRSVFTIHPQARLMELTQSPVEPGDHGGPRVEPSEDVVQLNFEVWVPRAYFVITVDPEARR